ncbi:MAG: SDR family oxidoreductase [bacterium]|nr:SDR family oxidoreductase [bacterium]
MGVGGRHWITGLTGKAAVVTGGARGIGYGIARYLVDCGMRVWIADCDHRGGEAAASLLSTGNDVRFMQCDVANEAEVRELFRVVAREEGGLDAVVCNAGISGPFGTRVEELTLEAWNHVIAVNLTGCFLCAKYGVPLLRARRGAMVLVGSTRAQQSEAHTEAYSASKGGVVALTHALAISLGPAVRVNCVSPGWIDVRAEEPVAKEVEPLREKDHAQHPVGRVGTVDDVAALTAFLLSPAA